MSDGKSKLLRAALSLFNQNGYDGVSIREIGQEAGLTNPALYQHFSSKADLGAALYRECYDRLIKAVDASIADHMHPLEKIERYIEASVDLHLQADPSPLPYLEDHQRQFGMPIAKEYGQRGVSRRLRSWIKEGQAGGSIRKDVPVEFLVASVIGQLTKWIMLSDLGLTPRKDAARILCRLVASTLSPKA